MDCVWQITDAAPRKMDAPVVRGKNSSPTASETPITGVWIWNRADAGNAAAGETVAFRKRWEWKELPPPVTAVVTCDNAYTLFVNGKRVQAGDNWEAPDLISLPGLKAGMNEILIVAQNGGSGPNPAGLFFEARWTDAAGKVHSLPSDNSWEWTAQQPDKAGKFKPQPDDWKPAAKVDGQQVWMSRLEPELASLLSRGSSAGQSMVRASLLKSDFLMRSLGRPNRDQIVSTRPLELTTLEAIDLSNGEALAKVLHQGAEKLQKRDWKSPAEFVAWLYRFALSREPTPDELRTLSESMGTELSVVAIEDVLWVVVMLPEFQLVR